MEQVDIQSSDVETDISDTETQVDTQEAPSVDSDPTQSQDSPENVEAAPKAHVPFGNGGKEKFKVNGQEKEWDWPTTQKYAQLGYAGQAALERAHETEQKAKKLYSDFMQYAQTDPEGLIRVLNPKFQGFSSQAKGAAAQAGQAPAQGQSQEQAEDPRDAKIRELEQRFEQQDIEKERQTIAAELETACKQYPELNNEINREYVKAQYHRSLKKGIDVTLEDVAFHAAQKVKEMRAAEAQERQKRLAKNKEKAPVSSLASGPAGEGGSMSREDVMRLAGKM